ncbi:hypothetical protein [Thioalkalivibrio thiocyanodenitrificans]|uniref:hypothetical protein n=1 Tax=Thioalkalivibrio thiocyanodenitrificans TaxID=243063 RepID=UPI0012EA4DCD|nr:hypothetical protein [Thioalkalivibrio thiocyanodenitrificans]
MGITKPGAVPSQAPRQKWEAAKNETMITFAEVKKLVVYPMLLAQFIGIVHELKPRFLNGRTPRNFIKEDHLFPALASLGNFSGNSSEIVKGYRSRNIRVTIAENFDFRLARVRGRHDLSPFVYRDVWDVSGREDR